MNQAPPTFPPRLQGEATSQGQPSSPGVRVKLPTVPPRVTYALLGICLVVYLAQVATNYLLGVDWPLVLGVKANEWIVRGELWRLFTPMFLHGSIIHIAFNMYALYNIGPQLERHYGHWRYLALYVLSGFAGNVASFVMSPYPSLGSSTAIFGLLGAEGVFLYQNREWFGSGARRALNNVITIAVINLIIGLSPGIDNWGHMGGLIGGTLFAWLGGPLLRLEGIFPAMSLVDGREQRTVLQAGFMVGTGFAMIAGLTIVLRGG